MDLTAKIEELQAALLARHPSMPTLLNEIYKNLKAQPENVTLLTEEQIKVVVEGIITQTGVTIVAPENKAAATKKLKAQINSGDAF